MDGIRVAMKVIRFERYSNRRDGAGIDIDFLAGQQSSSTVGTVGHHVYSME